MTLLEKLNKALGTVYGNSLINDDDNTNHYDYYCSICKEYVTEDAWNDGKNCCYKCGWKEEKGEENGTKG